LFVCLFVCLCYFSVLSSLDDGDNGDDVCLSSSSTSSSESNESSNPLLPTPRVFACFRATVLLCDERVRDVCVSVLITMYGCEVLFTVNFITYIHIYEYILYRLL
jgi:hypothetical protein